MKLCGDGDSRLFAVVDRCQTGVGSPHAPNVARTTSGVGTNALTRTLVVNRYAFTTRRFLIANDLGEAIADCC
jgi:hypothetical protein